MHKLLFKALLLSLILLAPEAQASIFNRDSVRDYIVEKEINCYEVKFLNGFECKEASNHDLWNLKNEIESVNRRIDSLGSDIDFAKRMQGAKGFLIGTQKRTVRESEKETKKLENYLDDLYELNTALNNPIATNSAQDVNDSFDRTAIKVLDKFQSIFGHLL